MHQHLNNARMPTNLTTNLSSMFSPMPPGIPTSMSSSTTPSFSIGMNQGMGITISHTTTQSSSQDGQPIGQHPQLNPNFNPMLSHSRSVIDTSLVHMSQGQQYPQHLEPFGRPTFGPVVGCSLETTSDLSIHSLSAIGPPAGFSSHSFGQPQSFGQPCSSIFFPSLAPAMPLGQFNPLTASHTDSSIGANVQNSSHIDFSNLTANPSQSMSTAPNYDTTNFGQSENHLTDFNSFINPQKTEELTSASASEVFQFSDQRPRRDSVESSDSQGTIFKETKKFLAFQQR